MFTIRGSVCYNNDGAPKEHDKENNMNLEFGKNLKRLRREKDMTQDELARALSLSVQAISRYETGAAYPDIEMLPVIAGFFGTTIDDLLGVSRAVREKREDEYAEKLRTITDRKERLELLRRQHAEFPDSWNVVANMAHQMVFLPECIGDLRELAEDGAKRCDEPLWRDNIIMHYLHGEPDDEKALDFIDKYCPRYDLTPTAALKLRYNCRGDWEKARGLVQKTLREDIVASLTALTERGGDSAEATIGVCERVLEFLDGLSGNGDRTDPDMWVDTKLRCMLRLANSCFSASRDDEGFLHLDEAVSLYENFFNLPNGTTLTYGSSKLDGMNAKTNKQVYHAITEFTGIIADSMMMILKYETPLGPVGRDGKYVHDMDGLESEMVFSASTYNLLRYASWDGLARVKDDPRYAELVKRAEAVSSFENTDNLMYLLGLQAKRTDDWIKEKEWVAALLVSGVGVYEIFDSPDEGGLEETLAQMKREGNTRVSRIATVKVGGDLIMPPETVLRAVAQLDESNIDAEILLRGSDGEFVFTNARDRLNEG